MAICSGLVKVLFISILNTLQIFFTPTHEPEKFDVILNGARNERNEESPKISNDVSKLGDSSGRRAPFRMTSVFLSNMLVRFMGVKAR